MKRQLIAQILLKRLNKKIQRTVNLKHTLILGVVLKGLPVAYGLAKMNDLVGNFVPLVAQRHLCMQHQIESYFPSLEWKSYFGKLLQASECVLIIDDVVNTGFTRQKVESIVHSLIQAESIVPQRFAALVLNRKKLANSTFTRQDDIFALEVNAADVACDWGLMTVPLWDLTVEEALQTCEEYFNRFWLDEKRLITVSY